MLRVKGRVGLGPAKPDRSFGSGRGNTTALWRHLTRFHPNLHADAKEKSKEEQNFLKLVAEWVVCINQSFSIVENPSFLKMMGYSSKYKTLTKYTLTKKILPELEKETKDKIKLILKDQRPSLTADVWESEYAHEDTFTSLKAAKKYLHIPELNPRLLNDTCKTQPLRHSGACVLYLRVI
ncbi:hypothetical protein PRIPAC_81331 [Pristionchus pacificus]|uniref:Uncharacterized protein n=1 Tax=Pristionchus pacificus TaxID=54126 RepID=A0A2A6CML3_PRIPA|nr:hypothetical protein PRIPAC_81331 [Pristionchus pacificus]|eukprot:PDM79261.1 hypothetical protein PRIPAC_31840 [Pristionchus pacificus]